MDCAHNQCVYVTLEDIRRTQCEKAHAETEEEKKHVFRYISKHDIKNAFTLPNIPLSDLIHGIYKISPSELLHAPGSDLIKDIFASIHARLLPESQRLYSDLHCQVSSDVSSQNMTSPGELIARVPLMGQNASQ